MNRLKFVFDCNVIVSTFLFQNSQPRLALEKGKNEGVILLSDTIINELVNVMKRKKFDRYLSVNIREMLLDNLIELADKITVNETIIDCREYIITGDNDLLVLNPFRQVEIIKPEEFLAKSF